MKHDIHSLIIYEDPHIIVCRKPAGVPTQSARISTPRHGKHAEKLFIRRISGRYPPPRPAGGRTPGFRKDPRGSQGIKPAAYLLRIWKILPCCRLRHPRTARGYTGGLFSKRRPHQYFPHLHKKYAGRKSRQASLQG